MNVLEMEQEIESLVGSKKSGPGAKRPKANVIESSVVKTVVQRNFLTNVVVVAGIVLVLLLYLSSGGSSDGGSSSSGDVQNKSPVAAPAVDHAHATPSDDETPVESPVASPTFPPVAPVPEPEEEDPLPINTYSKFATIPPNQFVQPPDKDAREKLTEKWGHWHFWDGEEDERPTEDYLSKFPNGDVPNDEFPEGAWQADAVFVNHFLSDAGQLVERAMEAIYAEYGYPGDGMTPEQLIERGQKIFHWLILNEDSTTPPSEEAKTAAGWMPKRSYDGLIRRLLHAMMTSSTFTVVVAGHSVVAGAGNKFQQNYAMQFHKIMEPIFARLGVKLITQNQGNGGLGTFQTAMGMSSIYGDEIDILLWDSGMTETTGRFQEFFVRQGLIGGKRVPVIWTHKMSTKITDMFYGEIGADVGGVNFNVQGIVETTGAAQAEALPYAIRYLQCSSEAKVLCKEFPRFCTRCWADSIGDGSIVPPTEQKENFSNNGNWHPGWRHHQFMGRLLAMGVLRALRDAIDLWTENVQGGPPLDESYWHVTDYYKDIQNKFLNLDPEMGECKGIASEGGYPARLCWTPMKGATQFTPRRPASTLSDIVKPAPDGYKPHNTKKVVYDAPQPLDPCLVIPEGEVDVYAIVSGRRMMSEGPLIPHRILHGDLPSQSVASQNFTMSPVTRTPPPTTKKAASTTISISKNVDSSRLFRQNSNVVQNRTLEEIVPGRGWEVIGEPVGRCDGTYYSNCNGGEEDSCIFSNYNSYRGGIFGNEFSGWLVMNLAGLKHGIIIIKLDLYHKPESSKMTTNWTTVNDERRLKGKYNRSEQPDTMVFDFAIDGKITSLPRDQFLSLLHKLAHTSDSLTALDDPNYTSGETRDVEFAIRMRGCGRICAYSVSHVYWA